METETIKIIYALALKYNMKLARVPRIWRETRNGLGIFSEIAEEKPEYVEFIEKYGIQKEE